MNIKIKFFTVILFLIFSSDIFSQYGSSGTVDSRSIGLAKTYTAASNGIYAVGINPANLFQMEEGSFELSTLLPLPFISFHTGTDFLSIEQLKYYFGGVEGKPRVLTEEDKRELNSLFEDGGKVFTSFSTTLFGFALKPSVDAGSFAFSVNDFAGGNFKIPQAIIDLGLNGNTVEKRYEFNDQNFSSWWIRNYGVSYAREFLFDSEDWLKQISAGVSFKLVQGFYFIELVKSNSHLFTNANYQIEAQADMIGYSAFSDGFGVKYDFDSTTRQSNFSLFMPPAGKGFGFDFGLSLLSHDNWQFSVSLTDIGKINWTENAAIFKTEGKAVINDFTDQDQLDSLKDKFTGKGEHIESFSSGLATALRVGISRKLNDEENFLPGNMLLALDYNQGFNNLPGNSTKPRVSFGIEWKIADWIPYLRSGVSFGGADDFAWALGLGIYTDLIEFNFATSYFQSVISPNSGKQISFALDSRWKF